MTVKIKPEITNFCMDAFNVGKDILMPNFVYFQFSGSGDKLLKVAGSQVENAQKWLLFQWLYADSDCMVHGARLLIVNWNLERFPDTSDFIAYSMPHGANLNSPYMSRAVAKTGNVMIFYHSCMSSEII